MKTTITLKHLTKSVIAVPPFAHEGNADESNQSLIRHIEAGGVSTLLYGGNANVQNWPVSRFGEWLDTLAKLVADDTWLIPSVGPDGGKILDQAALLAKRSFPAAMLLPFTGPKTDAGFARSVRDFVQASGTQAILYMKSDGYLSNDVIESLVADGSLFSVKYAIPRENTAIDPVLDDLISAIGTERIVSGFGEPPALPHLEHHKLSGFTAGCVCIAPSLSQAFLRSLQARDFSTARTQLKTFGALEALRDAGDPIRVLHTAVTLSGIADMGAPLPFLTEAEDSLHPQIETAARELLAAEMQARSIAA
ncbi:dihydrodipicolinate synthase family protein [Vreelandella populi]|uniref:dihydrodipicolinate synthase family protein n=1 Tax=Vreelandella populi TaxID=2498858 RepID=UPI000F8EC9FF|nr:dihydrodipicolinate synthase family protein [Halomonas populi]RUR57281.1 dihydrodipicolinate synthase family protein [Halomonas populi]